MKRLVWILLLTAAPALAQQPLGLDGPTAQIERDGQAFICSLRAEAGAAVTDVCLPLITQDQADRMAELPALADDMGAALDTATADAAAQRARAETAEAALAGAMASAAAAGAERDALRAALETATARVAALTAERDALAADAGAQAYLAKLRANVIALEQAAVTVGLVDDARVGVLARLSILALAGEFGDGCTLQRSVFTEQEREAQAVTVARVLDELAVDPDIAGLMIANLRPGDAGEDLPHNRMKAALDAALRAGDDDTYDKGTHALRIARTNLNTLGDRIGAKLGDGSLIEMAADQQSLRVIVPPCRS